MNFISKYIINREINKLQEKINKKYEKEGLTDTVLDQQLDVNTMRCLLDIPDDSKKIYKKYTQ